MNRYLIYRTDFNNTIIRESLTNNPGVNEASLFTNFVIPEIQPLYLWRVNGSNVEPNTDSDIRLWLDEIAPPPNSDDLVVYSQLTGNTAGKIDKITGATDNIAIFTVDGGLQDGGFTIPELTGLTTYQFVGSGGTTVDVSGNTITISSTIPTGTTVSWGDITGTLSNQTDLQNEFNSKLNVSDFNTYTGDTNSRLTDVEEITNIALTGGTNGLTVNGRNLKVGGTLSENTTITLTGHSLTIQDDRVTPRGIEYGDDYSLTYTNRSLVDKSYVDTVAGGLVPKDSVDVATTTTDGNINLTGFTGSIDGVLVLDGYRVLIKNQTSAIENGIYVYSSGTTSFTRAVDFDGTPQGEVSTGNLVPISFGDTLYGTVWTVTSTNPIIIDTDPITFTLFLTPKEFVEGVGISIDTNVISVDGANLVGDSIVWTGDTFNVDITSGALGTKLNEIDNEITNVQNDITFISGVTDNKLNISDFNTYTGDTETRLQGIETDISDLQNDVTGLTATKLDTTVFEQYTGNTSVVGLKLHLVVTGDTDVNQITPVTIEWDEVLIQDINYSFTGGTVEILETGEYEISYNVTLQNTTGNTSRSIGAYIIKDDGNGGEVIDRTATAAVVTGNDNSSHLGLSKVIYDFNAGDTFELIVFRIGGSGIVNAVGGSTTLLINRIS